MEIDGIIPPLKFSTRILNGVEGGGRKCLSVWQRILGFLGSFQVTTVKRCFESVKEIGAGAERRLHRDMPLAYPTCVPGVVAGSPGQIPGKAVAQVKDGPG